MSQNQTQSPQPPARPNEQGVIHVQGFLRISDPNSKKIIVEQRA